MNHMENIPCQYFNSYRSCGVRSSEAAPFPISAEPSYCSVNFTSVLTFSYNHVNLFVDHRNGACLATTE